MKNKNTLLLALGLGVGLSLSVSAVPLDCDHQFRQCIDSKAEGTDPELCEDRYFRCMSEHGENG